MKTYTVTEYEQKDYDNHKANLTYGQVISDLDAIADGYIGDYNFTGDERDFRLYQLHMALYAAMEIVGDYVKEHGKTINEKVNESE